MVATRSSCLRAVRVTVLCPRSGSKLLDTDPVSERVFEKWLPSMKIVKAWITFSKIAVEVCSTNFIHNIFIMACVFSL